MANTGKEIRARLVRDRTGKLTLVEDPTIDTQPSKRKIFKTTGLDGKVTFFFEDQPQKALDVLSVDEKEDVKGNTTKTSTAQLTDAQVKSLAKLLSTVKSKMTASKHQSSHVADFHGHDYSKTQSEEVSRPRSAPTQFPPLKALSGLKRSDSQKELNTNAPTTLSNHSTVFEKVLSISPSARQSPIQLGSKSCSSSSSSTSTSSSSSSSKLSASTSVHGPGGITSTTIIPPHVKYILTGKNVLNTPKTQTVSSSSVSTIVEVATQGTIQRKSSLHTKTHPDSILSKFINSVSQQTSASGSKPNLIGAAQQPQILKAQTSPIFGTQIPLIPGTEKPSIPGIQQPLILGAQNPIIIGTQQPSIIATHPPPGTVTLPVHATHNPLIMQVPQLPILPTQQYSVHENHGPSKSNSSFAHLKSQCLVLQPKPVGTVKPEKTLPQFNGSQRHTLVALGKHTYLVPVVTKQPVLFSTIRTPYVAQTMAGQRLALNPTTATQTQDLGDLPASQSTPVDRAVTPPEVAAEIFLEASDDVSDVVNCGHLDREPDEQRNGSMKNVSDTDTDEETSQREKLSPLCKTKNVTEHVDVINVSKYSDIPDHFDAFEDEKEKRVRKTPKRLISEDVNLKTSPTCPKRKKKFLKPIVFSPCFVVLERMRADLKTTPVKNSKRKKAKGTSKKFCTIVCRENFLMRLCKKRGIPCDAIVNKKNEIKNLGQEHKYSQKKKSLPRRKRPKFNTPLAQNPNTNIKNSAVDSGTHSTNAENNADYLPDIPGIDYLPDVSFSSEMTDTAEDESFIASDVEVTSHPWNHDTMQTDVNEAEVNEMDADNLSINQEEVIDEEFEDEPQSPEADIPDSPEPPSPECVQKVDEYLELEEMLKEAELGPEVKEESDDDWGNEELEVDPDSEEETKPAHKPVTSDVPDDAPSVNVTTDDGPSSVAMDIVPFCIPDFTVDVEDTNELSQDESVPASEVSTNTVLSEKVQRLKAMLAEQTEQVDCLRRKRRRIK